MPYLLLFLCLLLATAAYAWLRGGAPERWAAGLFISAYLLTIVVRSPWTNRYVLVETGVFAVDVALFLAMLTLALAANRFWPVWMTAIVAMPLAAHLVKLADSEIIPGAYQFLLAGWAYPTLALLAAATWRHQRRLRRLGADPSWSNSFPRAGRLTRALLRKD